MFRRMPAIHTLWPPAPLWLVGYGLTAVLLCSAVYYFHLPPLLALLLAAPAPAAVLQYRRPVTFGMSIITGLAVGSAAWLSGWSLAGALGAGLAALLVMLGALELLIRQNAVRAAWLQRAIDESELRFKNIVEQSTEGVCLTDALGRVVGWNPAYEALTGIPRAEVLNRPLWEVMERVVTPGIDPVKLAQQAQAMLADFMDTGQAIPEREIRIRNRAGEIRYLLITDFAFRTSQGMVGCSMARDVTAYRQAEQALVEHEAALRESEERFRLLFESSPDGIILTDVEKRIIVDCNENAARMNGYEREELINQSIDILNEPGHLNHYTPEELAAYEAIMEKGTLRAEVVHRRKDGTFFTIETAMRIIHKDGREVYLGIDRDISERKEIEAALRDSEALFRGVFNQSPMGVTIYDLNGRLVMVNSACLEIFGVTDVTTTEGFSLFDDPNLPDALKNDLRQGKKTRGELEFDFGLVTENNLYATNKSGKRWLDVFASPLFSEQAVTGYIVQMIDITERKRSQQAEHETRLLAEALVDGANALNSTLLLNEVLDLLLTSIGQILPHDAIMVMLVEEGLCQVVSQRNLFNQEEEPGAKPIVIPLESAPLLETVYQSRQWLISSDEPLIHSWLCRQPEYCWVRSVLIAPLISRHEVTGILALFSDLPDFFTEQHAQHLQAFAGQAASAISNARLYNEVHDLATHDELTGLLNRRAIITLGRREIERCRRFKRPLTVLFIDIDHFKQFNDRYSYEVGDQVLCFIARQLRVSVREVDLIARYGGEEFMAILTECGLPEAVDVAERLRQKIETTRAFTEMGELGVTISIGLAQIRLMPGLTGQLTGSDQKTLEELFQRAGQALHKAKQNGRNRVEISPDRPGH